MSGLILKSTDNHSTIVFTGEQKISTCFFVANDEKDFCVDFVLENEADFKLYILSIGNLKEKNNLVFNIKHHGENSKSFIWSKIIANDKSHQSIKVNVDMIGINGQSNNTQKQIILSGQAYSKCEPIIVTKGESIVANHGASSGLMLEEDFFFCQIRGLPPVKSLELLLKKEIYEINWPEEFQKTIEEKIQQFNWQKILEEIL